MLNAVHKHAFSFNYRIAILSRDMKRLSPNHLRTLSGHAQMDNFLITTIIRCRIVNKQLHDCDYVI